MKRKVKENREDTVLTTSGKIIHKDDIRTDYILDPHWSFINNFIPIPGDRASVFEKTEFMYYMNNITHYQIVLQKVKENHFTDEIDLNTIVKIENFLHQIQKGYQF